MPFKLIIIILLLFEGCFSNLGFTYIDELILFISIIVFLVRKSNRKILLERNDKIILELSIIIYLLGVISTFIYDYQNNLCLGLISGLFSSKFYFALLGGIALFDNKKISKKKLMVFLKFLEGFLSLSAILLIIDQFIPLFKFRYPRFNLHSTFYIFSWPTEVASFAILSMCLAIYIRFIFNFKLKPFLNIVPSIIWIICSGRYKGLAFLVVFISILLLRRFYKKFKIWYLLPVIPLVFLAVRNQLKFYMNPNEARFSLIRTAFIIAKDHFPLGAGFATFGTQFSKEFYSPLYYKYNISNVYGLGTDFSSYITDSQFAAILGETGFFGLLLSIVIFYFIYKKINVSIKYKNENAVAIALLAYLIIESTSDTILMTSRGCLIAFILCFMISLSRHKELHKL